MTDGEDPRHLVLSADAHPHRGGGTESFQNKDGEMIASPLLGYIIFGIKNAATRRRRRAM